MLLFLMGLYCIALIEVLKSSAIAAPNDVKRYFITPQESGELCILSAFFGENKDIFPLKKICI